MAVAICMCCGDHLSHMINGYNNTITNYKTLRYLEKGPEVTSANNHIKVARCHKNVSLYHKSTTFFWATDVHK